jgi:hypothetical protein
VNSSRLPTMTWMHSSLLTGIWNFSACRTTSQHNPPPYRLLRNIYQQCFLVMNKTPLGLSATVVPHDLLPLFQWHMQRCSRQPPLLYVVRTAHWHCSGITDSLLSTSQRHPPHWAILALAHIPFLRSPLILTLRYLAHWLKHRTRFKTKTLAVLRLGLLLTLTRATNWLETILLHNRLIHRTWLFDLKTMPTSISPWTRAPRRRPFLHLSLRISPLSWVIQWTHHWMDSPQDCSSNHHKSSSS